MKLKFTVFAAVAMLVSNAALADAKQAQTWIDKEFQPSSRTGWLCYRYFPCHTLPIAKPCLLYTSPSPRDRQKSRMPSSA